MISAKDVVRMARVNLLKDVDVDEYKWSDKRLLEALNNAVQKALKLKPILRWTSPRKVRDEDEFIVENLNDETMIDFPSHYTEALMYGVAADVYINLDADEVLAAMGQNFDGKFIQLMGM